MSCKFLTVTVLLFSCNLICSQSFENNFKNDICVSFEEEFSKVRNTQIAFKNCFVKALPAYAEIIDGAINEENQSEKFKKGQEAREALKQKFQVELIYSCDFYYLVKLEERNKLMARGVIGVSLADVPKLNELVAMYPKAMNYAKRGAVHLFLGNLKLAESDLRESISRNSDNQRFSSVSKQTALLALVMEEQNRLNEAKALYAQIYENTKDIEAAMFQALVNRRSGSKTNNLDFTNPIKVSNPNPNTKTNDTRAKPRRGDSNESSELRNLFNLDKSKKNN